MGLYKKMMYRTIVLASVVSMGFSSTAFAMTYKDVAVAHWAHTAIDSVSNKGYMVGDLDGKFNPDDFIDKFDTSKILAKLAGYKYSGATEEEELYYERCYENNKTFISQFSNKFKKWDSTYNKEIAYLLEKEIYTQEDINQFIVNVNNEERLRALSREEACMFLMKIMGKSNEALAMTPTDLFKDDASITLTYRPFVYLARSEKIVNGDNNGNFSPKNATTKAAMSIMIYCVLDAMDTTTNSEGTSTGIIETVQCSITKLYSTAHAVQISSSNEVFNDKIYVISSDATININGFVKTYADLKEGMSFVGVFSGNELIAVSVTGDDSTDVLSNAVAEEPKIKIEGTIVATKKDESGSYIDFETRTISPRGEIKSDVKTYGLAQNAKITRAGKDSEFASIVKGDIGFIGINDETVTVVELEEKDLAFTGTLIEKKYNELTAAPILVVKNSEGKTYDFGITTGTIISRKDTGETDINGLRVGDTVDVKAEYQVLKSIHGSGLKSSIDVWIKDIFISSKLSKVTATDSNNVEKVYPIISGGADIYSLRIGSKVRFRLDSSEVESFTVLENSTSNNIVSGTISNVTKTSITIKENSVTKEFQYDSNTVIINSKTGKAVSSSYLEKDMKIHVALSSKTTNLATAITILSE